MLHNTQFSYINFEHYGMLLQTQTFAPTFVFYVFSCCVEATLHFLSLKHVGFVVHAFSISTYEIKNVLWGTAQKCQCCSNNFPRGDTFQTYHNVVATFSVWEQQIKRFK